MPQKEFVIASQPIALQVNLSGCALFDLPPKVGQAVPAGAHVYAAQLQPPEHRRGVQHVEGEPGRMAVDRPVVELEHGVGLAEPKMEDRKRMGFGVLIFLITLAGLLFAAYRKIWKDAH